MLGVYSNPARGFMTLYPVADLGDDAVVALWKVGVRAKSQICKAEGFALLVMSCDRVLPIRINSKTVQQARQEAIKCVRSGEVTLLKSRYRGRHTVFERVETISVMRPGVAELDKAASLVAPSGVLLEKALSPQDPTDARMIAKRLGSQLRFAEQKVLGNKLEKYVKRLNVDWPNLSHKETSRHLASIRGELRKMLGTAAVEVMPTWSGKIETRLKGVFANARKVVQSNFLPSVGVSLRQPDVVAIGAIADQSGWWMRDAAGVRSDRLTARARKVVAQGLRDGLGRHDIGEMLQKTLPKAWQAMGSNYFTVVAAAAVNRARSYSEVSGYIEVGIEALEVQAVLDERTTEICRCLDGQVIDTHVVSQQIVGAMNVARPEDIRDASPFLKEITNQKTGVRSIVTANNGTKIADVVRSGVGRVDDRGIFKYFKAGNQLADANIGPPPYHHICRSWTIPVTTTVSVPRNKMARAGGGAPTAPKIVPKGGKPRPGVGPRPQIMHPKPTTREQPLVGDPDLIERYPFTQDFVTPGNLPARWYKDAATGELKHAAVYQRYQYDPQSRVIRGLGRPSQVAKPKDPLKDVLSDLSRKLKLSADTNGVVMNVEKLGTRTTKDFVLAETKQPAAHRVYTVRSTTTGELEYLKFNSDLRRKSRNALSDLRHAESAAKMEQALARMEKQGYLIRTKDASTVTFGKPAPKMAPKASPGPKRPPATPPKKTPKKKPTDPTIAPKPKPKIVAPNKKPPKKKPPQPPEPQQPASGKVDDYSEYGLIENKPVTEQLQKRIEMEGARLSDYLSNETAKMQSRFGRNLFDHERADRIRDFVAAETGSVSKFTRKVITDNTEAPNSFTKAVLKRTTQRKVRRGSMGANVLPSKVGLRKVSISDTAKLYNDAFEHLSQRVMDAALDKGLPRVFYATKVRGGAYHSHNFNAIVLPGEASAAEIKRIFRHEFGHYVDTLGKGKEAAIEFREIYATHGGRVFTKTYPSGFSYKYKRGKWEDEYCGRVYEHAAAETNSVMSESFAESTKLKLNKMYEANPDHVGYYMAQAKGSFIP